MGMHSQTVLPRAIPQGEVEITDRFRFRRVDVRRIVMLQPLKTHIFAQMSSQHVYSGYLYVWNQLHSLALSLLRSNPVTFSNSLTARSARPKLTLIVRIPRFFAVLRL
jgi:hypothetical protein